MEKEQEVLLTHGDSVDTVPENFKAVAHSGSIIAGTLSLTLLISLHLGFEQSGWGEENVLAIYSVFAMVAVDDSDCVSDAVIYSDYYNYK